MNLAKSAHELPWDELARIQDAVANREPTAPAARRAIDDAYSTIVDEVESHTPDSLRRRFLNLVSNRRKKYRRRRTIEESLARRSPAADDATNPVKVAMRREAAATVLGAVSPAEGALLCAIAAGHSYEDMAAAANERPGTIKSRVSRARSRLRRRLCEAAPAA